MLYCKILQHTTAYNGIHHHTTAYNMPIVFSQCNATLKCPGKRGDRCSFKAKFGSNYCGRHSRFVAQDTTPPTPPPPPPDDDTDCSICMESITSSFTCTPCNHYYHTRCLNQWKVRSNRCPCCRASLTTGQNQTNSERLVEHHRTFMPPTENPADNHQAASSYPFTPFSPRPRPLETTTLLQHSELGIEDVRYMRDSVRIGSYEHGYYTAIYQSMINRMQSIRM